MRTHPHLLSAFMASMPFEVQSSLVASASDDDLLQALGDLSGAGGWTQANALAGDIGWSEADGLAGLMGDLADCAGDPDEIGRRVRRAANRAGVSPQQMFGRMAQMLQGLRNGGGPTLPAAPGGSPRNAFMSSIAPGTPARGERFSWMAFPANAFINAGATVIVLKTTSQRYIRPVRMTFTERRTGAATILTTVSECKVGQEVQPAATGNAGTDNFSPFAVGIPVQFDPVEVNMPCEVTITASAAPAVNERIDFSVTWFGWMLK